MVKNDITISNIKRKCVSNQEKVCFQKDNLLDYYVLTRISSYPTWLFLRLGISANQTSAISILTASSGCILLIFGEYWITLTGALLVITGILLDNVDGNVARYNNTCSRYGEFLEALNEYIMVGLLFISAGVGLYNQPDPALNSLARLTLGVDINRAIYPILGFLSSFFFIFTYLIADRFGLTFSQKPHQFYQPKTSSKGDWWTIIYKTGVNLQSTSGLMLPFLLLAVIFEFLSVFVFFYALTATLGFIAIISRTVTQARKLN